MKTRFFFFTFILVIGGVFFLSAVNTSAQTDEAPAFDQKPSVVLDLWTYGNKGKYKDNFKIINASPFKDISLNIYGYDEKGKTWKVLGTSNLKSHSDTDSVSPTGKIRDFRWFAIHAQSNIAFNVQAVTKNNDIYFYILDNKITALEVKTQSKDAVPAFDTPSSVVLDLWANKGKGKYEDNIKMINTTKNANLLFNIFTYDQKNGRWMMIGTKNMGENKRGVDYNVWVGFVPADPDTIDSPWLGDIEDFRWLAVYSVDGIPFNTQVDTKRNDVTITILNK